LESFFLSITKMAFRVVNDAKYDSLKVTQTQLIPVATQSLVQKGGVEFNPDTNLFCGRANRGQVPLSDSIVSTIGVGVTPAGIGILPNGTKAYVADNNNYGLTYEGGSRCDSVTVIDLTTNMPTTTIVDASFNQPYTVTISNDGAIAYVTNSNGSTITMISTATDTVIGTISGFDGPSGMVITPDGKTGYVNNYGGPIAGSGNGTTVSVVNLLLNTITSTITVGRAPASLAITPNGAYVYTINYQTGLTDGTLSVITTSNNSCIINAMGGLAGPFGIAITPDGLRALVTNFGSNNFTPIGRTVSVISLAIPTSPVITSSLTLGIQPSGIAITPDGKWAYVSNYNTLYSDISNFTGLTAGTGIVNAINLDTLRVSPVNIIVGMSPDWISIHPSWAIALVSNFTSNTVSIIALI
jgi:DNA-binding beta-propeller fold protein YncE